MFGLFSLIWMLLIGLAAGWIATWLMNAGKPGLLGMMLVGVIGSFIGPFVIRLIGFKTVGFPASLVAAVLGAVLCIAAIRYFGPKF
ncbi:MAG: GlsB/YeaQ/YmgE family stress response membrane protein [Planctomycetota bacterium]